VALFGEMMDTHRAKVKPVKDRSVVAFRAITTTEAPIPRRPSSIFG
jgi:hypothetical protein